MKIYPSPNNSCASHACQRWLQALWPRGGFLLLIFALIAPWRMSAAPATPPRVLILADRVYDPTGPGKVMGGNTTFDPSKSLEARIACSLGFVVDYAYYSTATFVHPTTAPCSTTPVGTTREWKTIMGAGGATTPAVQDYRAVLICDPHCTSGGGLVNNSANAAGSVINFGPGSGPEGTTLVWGPSIQGNVCIDAEDFDDHFGQITHPQAAQFLTNVIRFVTGANGCTNFTGLYVSLGCSYVGAAANTPVPLLNYFGPFTVKGGAYYKALLVASHPVLTSGLTSAGLSSYPGHGTFLTWGANFLPIAIFTDTAAPKKIYPPAPAPPGAPYILARSCDNSITNLAPCCLNITNKAVDCMETNNTYRWQFCVTNCSTEAVGFLSFPDLSGSGVTIDHDIFQLPSVLYPGQGACVTLYLTNTAGLTNLCFLVGAHSTNLVQCCSITNCLTFAPCCAYVTNELAVTSSPNNCYTYTLRVKNVSQEIVKYIFFTPEDPSCLTFTPDVVQPTPNPLLPGQTTTVLISTKVCITCTTRPLCFLVSLHNSNLVQCCSTRHCLPPPINPPIALGSPADGTVFLTPANIPLAVDLSGDITFASVVYRANDQVVASNSVPPFSAIWSNAPAGDYVLRADGVETNGGGVWNSEGVTIYVLTDQDDTNAPPAPAPVLTSLTCVKNALTFCLPTTTGVTYHVEYTDSLSSSNWAVLQTIVGDGSTISVTNAITAAPQRFYRVRVDQ